jgi:hypothetical protein
MEKLSSGIALVLGGIALLIFIAILFAWPVQLLWNGCLVDAVDGVHPITFWQALGLTVLFSILFKSSTTSKQNN